jgi:hypothetical protein
MYEVMSCFVKFIHLCQILTKFWNSTLILPILWKSSFAQIIKFHFNFVKFMHLCQVLPKLKKIHIFLPNFWNYVQFCLDHGIPPLIFTFGICRYLAFYIFDIRYIRHLIYVDIWHLTYVNIWHLAYVKYWHM